MAKRAKGGDMAKGALEGVKVLDFTWYGAGPNCTKLLADMGATVVKIESSKRLDPVARGGHGPFKDNLPGPNRAYSFLCFNTSKLGMTLNMTHPRALDVAKRLVKWADVMMENFTPGVITRMGLGYEVVKEINPGIIMLSSSILGNMGTDNPRYKGRGGQAGISAAESGLTYLTGWPDLDPVGPGRPYGDWIQPMFSTMAIVGALDYRRRTGKGQFIDTTQLETITENMSPFILDYQANEREAMRMGNRDPWAVPHGAFRCRDGEYCIIAVFTQEQWKAFCVAMGNPGLAEEEKFATREARKANEDELERVVESWTLHYTPHEVMERLQAVRVPAGVVQTVADIVDKDPQYKALGSFPKLEHPVLGVVMHKAQPVKMSLTPGELRTAPCLGEHTEYVCLELLKMDWDEYAELSAKMVFE